MLKPRTESNKEIVTMSPAQQRHYAVAISEEMSAKQDNINAAASVAVRLKDERKKIAILVAQLRECRQTKGVSLNDLEKMTGISKSSLSRLENSKAPNPTLLTLQRYAAVVGMAVVSKIEPST